MINFVLRNGVKTALGKSKKEIADTEKEQRIREFRKEASRKASVANKRIQRLERNNLTNTPAYQQYIKSGGAKFGVKGKSYNEVQAEVSRLNNFLNSKTSTVKGTNNTLKEMAQNTGIKYNSLTELRQKSDKFFELASKVEQYLRNVDDMASAIGYQQIWESINQYTRDAKTDLSEAENDIDSMVEKVTKAIKEYNSPVTRPDELTGEENDWFPLKD